MIVVVLAVLGLCVGSFAYATVWRIHEQSKPQKSIKKQTQLSITKGRSMCDSCGHKLNSIDLIPLMSWLSLGGRCRYCRKPISLFHPLTELLTAALFVVSYLFWPLGDIQGLSAIAVFVSWLGCLVCFVILGVYDYKWKLLPDRMQIFLAIFSVVNFMAVVWLQGGLSTDTIRNLLVSFAVLPGLFGSLYFFSKGRWIGFGDVKLVPSLALLAPSASLALLVLFLASLFGSVISIAGLSSGRLKRTSHIPFGPFLILATFIVYIWGARITEWFVAFMGATP